MGIWGSSSSTSISPKALSMIMLQKDEEIRIAMKGELLDLDIDFSNPSLGKQFMEDAKSERHVFPGHLIVTNRRIVLLQQKEGLLGAKDEYRVREIIDLETVQGMAVDKKLFYGHHLTVSFLSKGHVHERGFRSKGLDQFQLVTMKGTLEQVIRKRWEEIELERNRERIQFVIDFSFLKDKMEQGGIALTTVKCPSCGGQVEIPDSGNVFRCEYCGSAVHAMDIFDKMKGLLYNL